MGHTLRPAVGLLIVLLCLACGKTVLADESNRLALSADSARETCTLGSVTTLSYEIEGGVAPYQLTVNGRAIDHSAARHYVPCRPSPIWTRMGAPEGETIQRIVVSVRDASGARAWAVAEHRLVHSLPALSNVTVTSDVNGPSAALLKLEWQTPNWRGERRTGEVAVRWRAAGTDEWTIEHRIGERLIGLRYRSHWTVETSPSGQRREYQIAQIRHVHDLQAPRALAWSDTIPVTTAVRPRELQAETTHDTITLSWGPHADGLDYVAALRAVEPHRVGADLELRVSTGPVYTARFDDLLPDTLYHVEVALDGDDQPDLHRFELRTEPAPAGWQPPPRLASDIRAAFSGREIAVTWSAPELGRRHSTRVCAGPRDRTRYAHECKVVPPGTANALVPPRGSRLGGDYSIAVSLLTQPAASVEVDVRLLTYDPDIPTGGSAAAAPRYSELHWAVHPIARPVEWVFEWDDRDAELSEFTWEDGGRRTIREVREGRYSVAVPWRQLPELVRVRLLRDGVWSPWSAPADVPRVFGPAVIHQINERPDILEIHWHPPKHDGAVVGYRLHLSRNDGPEEPIEVGLQTSAAIPIKEGDRRYTVQVAPLTTHGDEVGISYRHSYTRGPLELTLWAPANQPPCLPGVVTDVPIGWQITRGAPPFTLSIGEMLGFETDQRLGGTEVECRVSADGELREIRASVTDARGQQAVHSLGEGDLWIHAPDPEAEPVAITLGPRSVHRDRLWLTWEPCRRHYVAGLRWRVAGTEPWSQVLDLPSDNRTEGGYCRALLDGLAPLTTYEYQLSQYVGLDPRLQSGRLPWTQTQTVTTLGEPQGLTIVRDGARISISWQRQPDAWAYVVGLRAEGRSWWKRYEVSGESIENVNFYRVPQDLDLRAELLSPPLKRGAEEVPFELEPDLSYLQ